MSILASKLLEVADAEVGYLEKKSNANLDSATANPGTGNYTKYGRDLIKWIGSPYANGAAWCDMFVDWCFITAFGKDTAKSLLGGWSAYTPTSAQYFKNINCWIKTPKAGDVIFFKNSTRICHTGIVYKVDATIVYTIEGNTASNGKQGVFKKSYKLNNTTIAGYGRPNYEYEKPVTVENKTKGYHYGIDISANQGAIDFSLVKNEGIEFAVLRSTTANGKADAYFEQYYKGCNTHGIAVACYKYSYAKTVAESIKEAEGVIKLLNGRKMPIWLDLENVNQINTIGKAGLEKVANAFIATCKAAGYDVGIYCNLNWYKNYISANLKKSNIFWIARYGKNNGALGESYKPNVGEVAWQYTSVGHVDGIKGNVDLDVLY